MSEEASGKAVAPEPPADPNRYNVNFFRPPSPHARSNARLIVVLFVIWAVAVFGFQFLLIVFNRPTPEAAYTEYEAVWADVRSGAADAGQRRTFARVCLSVLGKNIALKPDHKTVMQKALTATVAGLLPQSERAGFLAAPDPERARAAIGLGREGLEPVMTALLPHSLVAVEDAALSPDIPAVMELYLVHNQSALTDFKFIGFPFHYWYTAQFLLLLFVVLCLVYAVAMDKVNKKHGFEDK